MWCGYSLSPAAQTGQEPASRTGGRVPLSAAARLPSGPDHCRTKAGFHSRHKGYAGYGLAGSGRAQCDLAVVHGGTDAIGLLQLLHAGQHLARLILQQGVAALQHQRRVQQAQGLIGTGQPHGRLLQGLLRLLLQPLLQALQLPGRIAQILLHLQLQALLQGLQPGRLLTHGALAVNCEVQALLQLLQPALALFLTALALLLQAQAEGLQVQLLRMHALAAARQPPAEAIQPLRCAIELALEQLLQALLACQRELPGILGRQRRQFGGSRRRGRAQVGAEIGNRDIGFMADAADQRERHPPGGAYGQGQVAHELVSFAGLQVCWRFDGPDRGAFCGA